MPLGTTMLTSLCDCSVTWIHYATSISCYTHLTNYIQEKTRDFVHWFLCYWRVGLPTTAKFPTLTLYGLVTPCGIGAFVNADSGMTCCLNDAELFCKQGTPASENVMKYMSVHPKIIFEGLSIPFSVKYWIYQFLGYPCFAITHNWKKSAKHTL